MRCSVPCARAPNLIFYAPRSESPPVRGREAHALSSTLSSSGTWSRRTSRCSAASASPTSSVRGVSGLPVLALQLRPKFVREPVGKLSVARCPPLAQEALGDQRFEPVEELG